MKLIGAGAVCRLLGVKYRTLYDWLRDGLVKPYRDTTGRGDFRQFRLFPDVFALSIGLGMRAHGLSLAVAGNAMKFCQRFDEVTLEWEFEHGKSYLVLVGEFPVKELLRPSEVASSRMLKRAHDAGAVLSILDLERHYKNLLAQADKEEANGISRERPAAGCDR